MRHMWTIGMASFRNFNEDSCQLLRFHVDKIGGQNLLLSDNVREQFVAVNIVIKHLRFTNQINSLHFESIYHLQRIFFQNLLK
jgi:hypothetical protein